VRLALLPLNPTVGDIAGNVRLAEQAARAAAARGADLVLLPELALCGYPPKDLLAEHGFVQRCEAATAELARLVAAFAPTMSMVVGTPLPAAGGACTNSLRVLRGGSVVARYDKRLLPTYDVFDEDRYFVPGTRGVVVAVPTQAGEVRVGLSICEDLWMGEDAGFHWRYADASDPIAELAALGAQVVLSASASPFVVGKAAKHLAIVRGHAVRHGVVVASVNQLGGNDELVFDGHACVVGPGGEMLGERDHWGDELAPEPLVVDVVRGGAVGGALGAALAREAPRASGAQLSSDSDASEVFACLRLGVRDYVHKTGFRKVLLGLSGGIDSALTAVIAAAALGPANVLGVAMPGPYSSEHSKSDAYALAEGLGMRRITLPLAGAFAGMVGSVDGAFATLGESKLGAQLPDLAEENLQSRIRGTMLMALSNRTGAMVLTTGNKSELAVGYATLYGDMNGGLAVLSDLSKQWVYRLSRFVNAEVGAGRALAGLAGVQRPPIPAGTIEKPPSAELRPNQTDQDSLPPYDVLDAILAMHVEQRWTADEVLAATRGRAGFDEATVQRVLRLVRIAEYKRKQAAIGLKVTTVAFGSGRRMPIAMRG
jgi:NAD+ synthase (glutamine-hydrolysing)